MAERAIKSVNVDPKVWDAAIAKAKSEGVSLSSLIRSYLTVYTTRPGK